MQSALLEPVANLENDSVLAQKWQLISSFVIDDVTAAEPFSLVLRREMNWTEHFTTLAINEYRKFMFLCSIYDEDLTPSVHVDTVWHLHLLYTKNYHRFCAEALSCAYLHHEPSRGNDEDDQMFADLYTDTLARYREIFNTIPPEEIWGRRV